jgi:hypothetical protein
MNYRMLRFISFVFKVIAVVLMVGAIVGAAAQLAGYLGFFPAEFYYNSNNFSVAPTLLYSGLATLIVGLLFGMMVYGNARMIDLSISADQQSRQAVTLLEQFTSGRR